MTELKTSISKTDRTEPRAWEAIFFTEPNFEGDTYVAQIGYAVDFGKALQETPDSLNDTLHSVKTGRLCKLKLYEDYSYGGGFEEVLGGSEANIRMGLTSFTAELDEDFISASIRDKLLNNEKEISGLKANLEACGKDKKDCKDRLVKTEVDLQKCKDKLEKCEKEGKEIKDQLDQKKEDDLKELKSNLKECTENGEKLKDQLNGLKQDEVDGLKEKLKECQEAGKDLKDQLGKSEKERDSLISRLLGKTEKN